MGSTLTGPMTALQRQRFHLPQRAVLITTLEAGGKRLRVASGFLRLEGGRLYLYMCWHTVAGLDPNERKLPPTGKWPRPSSIRVTLQDQQSRAPGVTAVGGTREIDLELYSRDGAPLWLQDRQYLPDADLAGAGLRYPFFHDAVKLPFPDIEVVQDALLTDTDSLLPSMMVLPGDTAVIVGYPYGYSALETPTAVVITTHVAAMFGKQRIREFLLDRAGAPGMSGGPVFVEQDGQLWPMGMYTGAVYPDRAADGVPKVSTLGTCANLTMCWSMPQLGFVPADSAEMTPVNPAPTE